MDRDKLYFVLFEQQKDFVEKKNFVPRELTSTVQSLLRLKLPIIITGIRRAGKSTLLRIIKNELQLLEKEYLYINFNDERFISFTPEDFQKINDFLQEQNYYEDCTIFIDEIQEVENWEKWVDRLKEKHSIIITGSNSKLLSREISTVLTGRSINVSLYPFSFREFLTAKNITTDNIRIDLKKQTVVRKEFQRFLALGGIPKFVLENEEKILTELYENIIYRDIVKRFNPRLEKPVKELSLFLISNASKEVSLRSLSAVTGVKNLSTAKSMLDTFEKAFLFCFVHRFDVSLRKQLQNPKKIYCVDNGFITSVGFRFSSDRGRLLENLVFIELKRRNKEVYYASGKRECDFITRKGTRVEEAIQVCYQLDEENRLREIAGVVRALEEFHLPEGLILTYDQEEKITLGQKKITVLPVWKWLLEQ